MLRTQVVEGELPYRVEIDGLHGAADSPRQAVLTALRVGRRVPQGCDASGAALYIFWNYKANPMWAQVIHILEQDTFGEHES